MPPLRERREEILELANAQLERKAAQYARTVRGFDPLALAALQNYAWPGNVRELNSVVERSLLLAGGDEIGWQTFGSRPPCPGRPRSRT